jgi:hypothetical protein
MSVQISDCIRAALTAVAFLGIAALAVFGIPHGFEEGIGWCDLFYRFQDVPLSLLGWRKGSTFRMNVTRSG